ncbi:MAG TPA: glycosyltransferase family 9 protein [Bdellovibrionota bacterium]|nr:glycosyltransferase family 9 protein [Bdellovibrionota bacterium]
MPATRPYESILVRTPNWIGDQILSYPFFHFLRRGYPRARITVACVPWVEAVQFRNLVDDVITLPRPEGDALWARFAALEQGAALARAKGPFDLGIALPNSFSAAWFLWRAGARARRGFASDGRSWLLTERLPWREEPILHRAEAYVSVLPETARPKVEIKEFWGVSPKPGDVLDPGVPGVIPRFEPAQAWPDADPLEVPAEPYWVLAPGAVAESRRWPVERFAELARTICGETGWKCVVVGGVAEARLADKILAELGSEKVLDWTAQGSVTRLWKLLRSSRFAVTNDSGLAHVAALCSFPGGPPVYIVWGAGEPKRTEPLGPSQIRMLLNPVDCWPCERNSCSLPSAQKVECLRGIHPDAVWEEIRVGIRHRQERDGAATLGPGPARG